MKRRPKRTAKRLSTTKTSSIMGDHAPTIGSVSPTRAKMEFVWGFQKHSSAMSTRTVMLSSTVTELMSGPTRAHAKSFLRIMKSAKRTCIAKSAPTAGITLLKTNKQIRSAASPCTARTTAFSLGGVQLILPTLPTRTTCITARIAREASHSP